MRFYICHIVSGDLWAGAEVMAYQLIKGLKEANSVNMLVVLLNDGRLADELINLGVTVRVIDENVTSFFGIVKPIRRVLREFQPDIVHTHRYKENILARWALRGQERPGLIATQHGIPENYKGLSSLRHSVALRYNFHILRKRFDKVVAVSKDISRYFSNVLGFAENKIQVIHNGIEIPRSARVRKAGDEFVVGSCGRLFPVKDYPLMIKAAKECTERNKNIRFELAGDGPEMQHLRDLVARLGLEDRFTFKGHVDDMDNFYRGLDAFINTSLHEGIPMSVLEAMSFGLPVVAPNVGGLPEIIENGIEGFLVDDRDPSLFAKKCRLLCDDEELWQRMSMAARLKVERCFSVNVMAEKYYNLYLSLCGMR